MYRILQIIWRFLIGIIKLILFGLVVCISLITVINFFVIGSTYGDFYTVSDLATTEMMADEVPILVLGAGIIDNSKPSGILANRLDMAIELHQLAPNKTIVVSGDHTDQYYNEVAVMQDYLIEHGVDEKKIVLDPKGFSTYESIEQLPQIMDTERVIICTQGYHLSRALMIAKGSGLEAVGVPCEEVGSGRFKREVREIFARVKDVMVVYFGYEQPFI